MPEYHKTFRYGATIDIDTDAVSCEIRITPNNPAPTRLTLLELIELHDYLTYIRMSLEAAVRRNPMLP